MNTNNPQFETSTIVRRILDRFVLLIGALLIGATILSAVGYIILTLVEGWPASGIFTAVLVTAGFCALGFRTILERSTRSQARKEATVRPDATP